MIGTQYPIEIPKEGEIKVTQRMDFHNFIFYYRQKMVEVLANRDLVSYEQMQNALWHILSPYWDDEIKQEWKTADEMRHADRNNRINYERIYEKDRIISKLLDDIGALFKRKKKMRISKGCKILWEKYPPF